MILKILLNMEVTYCSYNLNDPNRAESTGKNVNLSKWNRSIWNMGHAGIIIIFGSAKMSSYAK